MCFGFIFCFGKLDEFDAIGVNIARKLKKINTQQILAESFFQKIIKKDLFNQLIEYTNINEVPHPRSINFYHYNTNQQNFVHPPAPSKNNDSSSISLTSQYYEEAGRSGLDV